METTIWDLGFRILGFRVKVVFLGDYIGDYYRGY